MRPDARVALALAPARDDDGQAVFSAQPITGPAYLIVVTLVGMVVFVVGEVEIVVSMGKRRSALSGMGHLVLIRSHSSAVIRPCRMMGVCNFP